MTIEDRARLGQSLPDNVLEQVKQCDVLLKGPMVTPRPGEEWPNMVSANSLLRRSLDLFAAVRPVSIPERTSTGRSFAKTLKASISGATKASR